MSELITYEGEAKARSLNHDVDDGHVPKAVLRIKSIKGEKWTLGSRENDTNTYEATSDMKASGRATINIDSSRATRVRNIGSQAQPAQPR